MAKELQGDSETKLVANIKSAELLVAELQDVIRRTKECDANHYARVILEQMNFDGPWRLTIAVVPGED